MRHAFIAGTAMALLVTGCASQPGRDAGPGRGVPPEYQDAHTGVTVTRTEKPMIFGLAASSRGNPRDFVSVMAAATNRTGTLRYLLLVYVWSSEPDGLASASRPLLLTADDQRLSFQSVPMDVIEADLSAPIPPPAGAGPLWAAYTADLATLSSLAAAQRLTVQISAEPEAARFELWDDQRAALGQFVRYLNGE